MEAVILWDVITMIIRSSRFIAMTTLLIVAATVMAQTGRTGSSAWGAQVDKVFAEWNRPDSPGCALALFQDGKIIYELGYGMADLEHNVPITPETVFYVRSLSKQFTAMAAALAIQQGRLSHDDDIRKYLPELPSYGPVVTVRHLIHHTSGLRDVNTLLTMAGRRGDEAFNNLEVLRLVARQKALNFNPGEQYLYSNSGYAFLALAVERATGTPFGKYAEANIFKPLGMTVTHFHDDLSRIVKHRAYAYERRPSGEIRLDTPYNERSGAGGVMTNVRELLKWDENFFDGHVGGKSLIEQLQVPGRLNSGQALNYAWGLQVTTYRGLRLVEHGGSLGGYRAHLMRFPERHFSIACLCNLGSINPGALSRQVADIYLADHFTEPKPTTAAIGGSNAQRPPRETPLPPLSVKQLADYAGTYYSDELEATFVVLVQGGRLAVRRGLQREATPLEPDSTDQFRLAGMTVRFNRDANGRINGMSVQAGRVQNIRFVKQP